MPAGVGGGPGEEGTAGTAMGRTGTGAIGTAEDQTDTTQTSGVQIGDMVVVAGAVLVGETFEITVVSAQGVPTGTLVTTGVSVAETVLLAVGGLGIKILEGVKETLGIWAGEVQTWGEVEALGVEVHKEVWVGGSARTEASRTLAAQIAKVRNNNT